MPAALIRGFVSGLSAIALCGCSGLLPDASPTAPSSTAPKDPTPLSKCQVAANASSPLVTEWPASEKAHLQSLTSGQTVAVAYGGCELRIIDGCTLPGQYAWSRTTLATDTLEITNADELYAKLPIGAVGLEGELERSGRLAVRTTVAGQLRSQGMTQAAPTDPACAEATHYISAISIGSFQLMSGSDSSAGGSVGVAGLGGGTKGTHKEQVLREAGSREACAETTDDAPNSQCASPIQVFLTPIAPKAAATTQVAASTPEDLSRQAAVDIAFPAPDDEEEVWTVRAPGGRLVCQTPCDAWVGPVSGYYLQREPRDGASMVTVPLPQSFPHPVGSHVTAEYQAKRGSPELSRWVFYGSIPMGLVGVGLTTWGIVQLTSTCHDALGQEEECFPGGGFLIGVGIFEMAMAGAATWWFYWSRDEKFTTYENFSKTSRSDSGVKVMIGPGSVFGKF